MLWKKTGSKVWPEKNRLGPFFLDILLKLPVGRSNVIASQNKCYVTSRIVDIWQKNLSRTFLLIRPVEKDIIFFDFFFNDLGPICIEIRN